MVNCVNQAAQFGLTKSAKILVPLVDEYMAKGDEGQLRQRRLDRAVLLASTTTEVPRREEIRRRVLGNATGAPAVERRGVRVRRHLDLQDGGRESGLDGSRPRSIAVLESTKFQFTKEQEWYRKEDHQGVNSCLVVEGIPESQRGAGGFELREGARSARRRERACSRSRASRARWNRRRHSGFATSRRAGASVRRPVPYPSASRSHVEALIQALLNGLVLGLIYVAIAVGLTIIFGTLRLVNFAHGAFYAIGAYVGLVVAQRSGSSPASSPRRSPSRSSRSCSTACCCARSTKKTRPRRCCVTFGIALVVEETLRLIFGATTQQYPLPELCRLGHARVRSRIPRIGCCSRPACIVMLAARVAVHRANRLRLDRARGHARPHDGATPGRQHPPAPRRSCSRWAPRSRGSSARRRRRSTASIRRPGSRSSCRRSSSSWSADSAASGARCSAVC